MADMTTIKGRIAETIYPNGTGAITAESHQALLLEMVDDINAKKADQSELIATQESLDALEQKVDNLPQGEEFDTEGNYPSLHVGTADTAIDLAGRGESVPAEFGFRASGGKSIKDGRAYIKRIKGNSVVWNQKLGDASWSIQFNNSEIAKSKEGATYIISYNDFEPTEGDKSNHGFLLLNRISFHAHKYLFIADAQGQYIEAVKCGIYDGSQYLFLGQGAVNNNRCVYFHTFSSAFISILVRFDVDVNSSNYAKANTIRLTPRIYDLTKMFGAGNEPTTIEEFNARVATLGVDMNAYNEGQVIHCNTESIKSVGDNAWDEEWELGNIDGNTGELIGGTFVRSKNLIPIIGGEQYWCNKREQLAYNGLFCYDSEGAYIQRVDSSTGYYTLPQNAAFIRFRMSSIYGTTYNNDIMITLVHSGWKQDTDAGYQPYWQDTLPLPIIRKYFPDGMKKAGTAHDEIRFNKASGKWEYSKGKIKSVDLGTLNWGLAPQMYFRANLPSDSIIPTSANYNGFLCAKYERVNFNLIYGQSVTTPCFGVSANNGMICVYDSAYTDAATFKAAMQGVILYYESNDWEWVELDAEDQNFRDYYQVADFGTEMSQSSVPSAAFSADIIYQFNAVDMIREHEIEITELQNVIATMQAQLASLINKE